MHSCSATARSVRRSGRRRHHSDTSMYVHVVRATVANCVRVCDCVSIGFLWVFWTCAAEWRMVMLGHVVVSVREHCCSVVFGFFFLALSLFSSLCMRPSPHGLMGPSLVYYWGLIEKKRRYFGCQIYRRPYYRRAFGSLLDVSVHKQIQIRNVISCALPRELAHFGLYVCVRVMRTNLINKA